MPAVSPLSTGLFETHVQRARAFLSEGKADLAEKDLAEAYLLKPRDVTVLSLLGVLYFKQGRLERAEEVFGKLAASSPNDAAILFNLGLINFKLNRFREAELAFTQALAFSADKPRVHFYLAATYERHGRIREAIHQYRLARSASDHTGAFRQHGAQTTEIPRDLASDTEPPAPNTTKPIPAPLDNDFRGGDEDDEALFGASKLVQVPGADLQARDQGPMPDAPVALRPEVLRLGAEEEDLFLGPRTPAVTPKMTLKRRDLLQIPFEGRIFFKRGALVSSEGHVTFWVKESKSASGERLVIATGSGSLLLAAAGQGIGLLLSDPGRKLWVSPDRILACEDALQPRYVQIAAMEASVLEMEGHGYAALTWKGLPTCMRVHPDQPFEGPISKVIAWSGSLEAEMGLSPTGDEPTLFIAGDGEVLFEGD
ncbi:MAG TPA: tetratricopeptide repeat protein [Vicinamibacteria bacterium]|nr:tetratricopeptide repeat protein [Vicinamibacteria bacterium]